MKAIVALLTAVFLGAAAAPALAAERPVDGDFRTLKLGLLASEMSEEGYYAFACGSNGGPPLRAIEGWTDFARCAPEEASGLHEVYVEYDDELATRAEALTRLGADARSVGKYSGTRVAGHPVVLSVLFDNDGVVRGLRAVTDSRAKYEDRRKAYLLRIPIQFRYGRRNWSCADIDPAPGETPLGDIFIKLHCQKIAADRRLVLETHLYRKAGQRGVDDNDQLAVGEFRSEARIEIWDLSVGF